MRNVGREPTSRTDPANATLHAALVRLHQEDPSATRRLLQPLQACSYEENVQYLDQDTMFGAEPSFGAAAIPAGQYDPGYQFWNPRTENGITNFSASTPQSRVIPFTHADCCLRCQLLFGCQGVRRPATLEKPCHTFEPVQTLAPI